MEEVIETTLLGGQLKLLQPQKGLRASTDTVFLAAAVPPLPTGARLLDAGCGSGAAGLCYALKSADISLIGMDIQPELVELASKNAAINHLENRCSFQKGDVTDLESLAGLERSFDAVMINPPYLEAGTHTDAHDKERSMALGESGSGARLLDWIRYSHRVLKSGGHLTMIHRSDRLDDIIRILSERRWFGGIIIHPLWPRAGADARRVIIGATKDRHHPLKIQSGTILHEPDGTYTPTANSILKGEKSLELKEY